MEFEQIIGKLQKNGEEPRQLTPESSFQFRCHKGVSCFNKCCANLEIFLTPLDILRLKKRLGVSSGAFLAEHTDPVVLEQTLLPMVKLKLGEDGKCRFVSPDGCTIYEDRPLACRYYPLGFGALVGGDRKGREIFFLIREDHCKGFEEDGTWTVREWREDQGISGYDYANKDWIDIILRKKLQAKDLMPDERSVMLFFMGSYDIDSFRDFVFGSKFLDTFDIDEDTVELIREDETELMKFAHRWLKYVLFKEPTVILKADAQ